MSTEPTKIATGEIALDGGGAHVTEPDACVLPDPEGGGWYVCHPELLPYYVRRDGTIEQLQFIDHERFDWGAD